MNIRILGGVLVIATAIAGCDVKQTEEGELPDVDVSVEGGNMPEYDVDVPEVDVDTKEVEVEVPDVDVDVSTEKKQMEVPDIDVTMPDEQD